MTAEGKEATTMADPRKQEANADMRLMAANLRQMYVALRNEGFNEPQALAIIGQTIAGAMIANGNKEDEDDG
jgi:hypothetical protein